MIHQATFSPIATVPQSNKHTLQADRTPRATDRRSCSSKNLYPGYRRMILRRESSAYILCYEAPPASSSAGDAGEPSGVLGFSFSSTPCPLHNGQELRP